MIKLKSGNNNMKATKNLIAGEVFNIKKKLLNKYEKIYLKSFNDKQFVIKVSKQLQNDCGTHLVKIDENDSEYTLTATRR